MADGASEGHVVERCAEPEAWGDNGDLGDLGGDFFGGGGGKERVGSEREVSSVLFDGTGRNENNCVFSIQGIDVGPGELGEPHVIGWGRGR